MDEYDLMGNYSGGYDDSYDNYAYTPEPVAPQPISYDPFGNPVYNEEEERRKREEELRQIEEYKKQQQALGSEVSHKQEVTTYADGSQTVKTQKEVPAQTSAVQLPQIKQRLEPIAPQSPEQARYNQQIAQQESGGRQDIGYHDQSKSSAYGPYGITQAAYQDARKQNPYLPEDIRQATPEQMTQAQNAVTQNNAKYLQSYGVPVNNNTLQAAHFAGAKGLSDFLTKKDELGRPYISPAAQQANGGYERTAAIIKARLGGQPAAASGAGQQRPQPVSPQAPAPAPQAEPAQEPPRMAPNSYDEFGTPVYSPAQAQLDTQLKTYESIQNDPKALLNFEGPDWMQARAKARAADVLSNERDKQRAEDSIKKADPKDLARTMMREPTDRWEIIKKSAMFRLLGANQLADAELGKLGSTVEKYVQGSDGKAYLLNTKPNGEVVNGYNAETGAKLTDNELVKVSAGVTGAGKLNIVGGSYVNDKTGEVGRMVTDERTGNTYIQTDAGRKPMAGFRPQGQSGTLDMQKAQQIQKQNLDLQADWAKASIAIAKAGPQAAAEEAGKFNFKHGTNYTPQQFSGSAPQISMETGQMLQAAPTAQTAPAVAPAATQVVQQATPAVPGATTAGTTTAGAKPGTTYVTPADLEAQREREKKEREAGLEVQTTEQKEFVKETKPAVGQTASDGQAVANARRQQLDIIKRNPSIVNIMNGQGTQYDQARRIMINAISGAYGAEERQQLATDLGQVMNKLTEAEQGALTEFVNLNTVVNAKTLRANAGPGAVSDAEQRANKEANVGNVDRIPAYAAMAGLHRSQFNGDLAASKQAFLQANPQFKTTSEFNSAWQKQEALRLKEYQAIAKARFDVMGRAPESSASPEAIKAYRNRVFVAFEAYPAPQYDMATNKWNYQTANARRAAMAAVLGQ